MAPTADIQNSFKGGQDASLAPEDIAEDAYAAGVNVLTDKGVLGPRFSFNRRTLKFPSGGYVYKFNKVAEYKFLFKSGKFQAMAPYRIGEKAYQVVVINGIIFMISQDDFTVQCLTMNQNTQLSQTAYRIPWFDAGKYLVFTDWPQRPIIIDDGVARRSDPAQYELPVIHLGTYNNRRAMFCNNANEFTGGDPRGNPATPLAPVSIQEIAIPNAPFFQDVYQVDSKYDAPISAMTSLQAVDDITGIGALINGTRDQIFAYDTTNPRADWLTTKFGRCISYNTGIAGHRSFTNVGQDLFFISKDGQFRALSAAQSEQKKWASVPMSLQVNNWIYYQDEDLVKYNVLSYFRNKIFWSVRPYYTTALRLDERPILDVAFKGMLVLNMDNVARTFEDAQPAWDGLWTGVNPMDMNINDERMFIMSKDSGSNELYEVIPEKSVDRTDEGYTRQIKSIVYTREYFFQNLYTDKRLIRIESDFSDLTGEFIYNIEYKTSDAPYFYQFGSYKQNILLGYKEFCNNDIRERVPLSLKELSINYPNTPEGNPITHDLYRMCKKVQLRLEIKGDSWQLNSYMITADEQDFVITKPETREYPTAQAYKKVYNDFDYQEFGQ